MLHHEHYGLIVAILEIWAENIKKNASLKTKHINLTKVFRWPGAYDNYSYKCNIYIYIKKILVTNWKDTDLCHYVKIEFKMKQH